MKEVHLGSVEKEMVGNVCPCCGRTAAGGTAIDDKETSRNPKPGDVAICLYCGALNVCSETLKLRRTERPERRRLLRDPRLKKLVELASWAAQDKRREWQ
jgi:hypothetical protein